MNWRSGLCAALLLASGLPAIAADVDYAKSTITFVSKQMNVPVEGRFGKFSAQIAFDANKPAASRAELEVDLASVDTGSTDADAEVARKTWFNTAAFPKARFISASVRQTGPDRYEAQGQLSIKGISRNVTAPFSVKVRGNTTTFEGGFVLPRLQYRIGEGIWSDTETVADEVQVSFRIVTIAGE